MELLPIWREFIRGADRTAILPGIVSRLRQYMHAEARCVPNSCQPMIMMSPVPKWRSRGLARIRFRSSLGRRHHGTSW
jgi:hypothetical protein